MSSQDIINVFGGVLAGLNHHLQLGEEVEFEELVPLRYSLLPLEQVLVPLRTAVLSYPFKDVKVLVIMAVDFLQHSLLLSR